MREHVSVIGLGPMGQAMVGALLAAGHPTTVWNRTAARAQEVVAAGAVLAPTVADALDAGELVLLSLTDYQAMYDVLGRGGSAHGAALMAAAGVDAATSLPYATQFAETLPPSLATPAASFDTGTHPGDQASATMMGATADHVVAASIEAGVDPTLPQA